MHKYRVPFTKKQRKETNEPADCIENHTRQETSKIQQSKQVRNQQIKQGTCKNMCI